MHPYISSLDVYAHPFNHRFFNCGNYSDVISAYHQGSRHDSFMFLPFNFDFMTGTLSQLDGDANLEVDRNVFGIAEEIAIAVFEDYKDQDVKPEVKQHLLLGPVKNMSVSDSPRPHADFLCSPVTPPAHRHHPHQEQSPLTPTRNNNASPTTPTRLTYAQVACSPPSPQCRTPRKKTQ